MGPKIKAFLIKLFAMHDKENVNVFSENRRCLEVENFPAAAKDVKDLLAYEMTNNWSSNVTLLLHVTGLIPFATFKGKFFNWLKINNIYINITIFWNTKETITKIGHLTMINPTRIYRVACQEHLNEALAMVAFELHKEDPTYFPIMGPHGRLQIMMYKLNWRQHS